MMAMARKVIIIDFKFVVPMHMFALASIILALGITYYLLGKNKDDVVKP
tara:strand:- start:13807 stop:13953 length:147 start_codon:yes stop_codon:yes gene_type:complete